ncbi:8105_t:CDS:2 [Diversispora eburnea]|uniref:8105_t:CDS:1 n=1 Tax=Diversispora eburnea TaxID=1213867 RepID=A0A9N8ZAZ2_9GLOM|nr:8105_t:CDS:2 [Diversispora eburnea]
MTVIIGQIGASIHKNQAEEIHVAAIDFGVHTFLTWYSLKIGHGNISDKDINCIFCLGHALNSFILCTTKVSAKK